MYKRLEIALCLRQFLVLVDVFDQTYRNSFWECMILKFDWRRYRITSTGNACGSVGF